MEGSNYWGYGYRTQHSEVAVNHLKKARGEIWPKRSERRKSAINKKIILRLRSLISTWFQLKTSLFFMFLCLGLVGLSILPSFVHSIRRILSVRVSCCLLGGQSCVFQPLWWCILRKKGMFLFLSGFFYRRRNVCGLSLFCPQQIIVITFFRFWECKCAVYFHDFFSGNV